MDLSRKIEKPNPREKANCLSRLLWTWTFDIFKTGYTKILGPEDLYVPLETDVSSELGNRLERQWNLEFNRAKKKKKRPSLFKTIARTFAWEYFLLGILQIFNEFILRLSTPILLGGLLAYFKPNTSSTYENALVFAGGIALTSATTAISINQSVFGALHVGGKIRIAICSLVYRKALKLSLTILGDTAPGKIVNLVANDVNRFDIVSYFIHYMWTAPTSAVIVGCILYNEIGWPGVIGILAVFTVVPIQSYAGKLSSIYRLQTAIKTDERIRLMDEIISGVQVIKMYAWEKPFCALVELARKLELRVVRKSSYVRGLYMTFNLFTTRMALYCTLICMLLTNRQLTADRVFVISAYFNILAHTMSAMFVRGFAEIAECLVAVKRLQNLLLFEEFQDGNVTNVTQTVRFNEVINHLDSKNKLDVDDIGNSDSEKKIYLDKTILTDSEDWSVKLVNVTAKWDLQSSETTLENVDLSVEKGKIYCLIGTVGAGKSSLLSSILGEVNIIEGKVKVKGTVSYACQESWVFGASVRQNIVFGDSFDRQRYNSVVKACALRKDFEQFSEGDQTIVGERGSSLSGGQKARINLARAVYRQADIYLLDDPLSAVDTHVGKHLFKECLQRYLKGKTVILATHQLQYLKDVDKIILIDHGKIQIFSDYVELLDVYPEYQSLLASEQEEVNTEGMNNRSRKISRQISTSTIRSHVDEITEVEIDPVDNEDDSKRLDHLLEASSKGKNKNIACTYFNAGANMFFLFLLLCLFILTQCATSMTDYFIPQLIKAEESREYWRLMGNETDNVPINDSHSQILNQDDILPRPVYIKIYSVLVFSIFLIGIMRSTAFYTVCVRSSQRLHDMVFEALIQTPMRFFDTNPSGRILNRFSKDMGGIDESLPKAVLDGAQIILQMAGVLVVSSTVNPLFLIPIGILFFLFGWIRKVYLKTSKNIRRLEGITRAPVFTHLNATLHGLSTIRAYRAQNILIKEFDNCQNTNTSAWFIFITATSAFGFMLDVCCFMFTTLTTFSFLILKNQFSGGEVGLAITQVMSLTGMVQWGMRQAAEVENQMMSVERVLEYILLPPEQNLRDKGILRKKKIKAITKDELIPVPPTWPNRGLLEFEKVSMRYSEDTPVVLKELSLKIEPGEKIGIVGRTGAGKSSLISTLFRLTKVEGTLKIDEIDTAFIALEDLRKHISIIPQDPVLFSGTLRRNLDPFNEFPDRELWDVLEEVELKEAVLATGNGLDHRVLDRGSNYSVGQRQLVCLARAILRNNRILMLDEATANVDPHTDALIQKTIRTKFAPCTVLTVAHRLNTIMDSDKVLVMDKGKLVEFDHPYILLQNSDGIFTSLVKETGRAMYDQLYKVAKDAYLAINTDL